MLLDWRPPLEARGRRPSSHCSPSKCAISPCEPLQCQKRNRTGSTLGVGWAASYVLHVTRHAAKVRSQRTRRTGCVRAEHAYSGTSCGSLTLEVGKSPTEVTRGRHVPGSLPSAICEFDSSSSCSWSLPRRSTQGETFKQLSLVLVRPRELFRAASSNP